MRQALVPAVALASLLSAEARSYTSLLAPRNYQFSRSLRDPFDMIGSVMPLYFNSLMHQFDGDLGSMARATTPRYVVNEDTESGVIELLMEIPGVEPNDLTVELENNRLLRVKGSRKYKHHPSVYASEFDQVFQLDDRVDPNELKVTLSHGILRVQAPKKENTVKRLSIETDETEWRVLSPQEPQKEESVEADIKTTEEGEIVITEE